MTDQQPVKKNPALVFIGLAVAGVAAVMAVTKDRWMPPAPPPAATEASAPAQQPAAEQPAAQATTESQQPAAEQPAAQATTETQQPATQATTETQQPAAEQPAQQATTETQQPAAEQPPQQATTETQQPAATETQQSAGSVGEPASASGTAAEQPAQQPAAAASSDAVPSFDTVRVEKTGEAVIAGRAKPGSDVTVMLDGNPIGTAVAGADGSFVVVPEKPIPPGSGGISIVAKGQGETVVTKSEQTVAVIVPEPEKKQDALVAVISPNQPTKVLQSPAAPAATEQASTAPATTTEQAPATKARQIVLDAVDYDAAGNIVFSGKGEPGNSARIYVDNAQVGDAPIASDGAWSFSGTAKVVPGVHALRIDSVDAGGAVTSRIEVPFFREENKEVAAANQTVEKTDAQAPAGTAQPTSAPPDEGRVVIQPGNNLWRIAKVIYGEGTKYTLLYQANKDQIRNPDLIYPGQVFRTPDTVPPETIDPEARDPIATPSAVQ
jgi:hypothetical protein